MKKLFVFLRLRLLTLLSSVSVLLAASIMLSNEIVGSYASPYTYDSLDAVPKNRVGLLLGTSKFTRNQNLNKYYDHRIKAAFDLFESKKINYILISGDNRYDYYNEPQMMLEDLVKMGIPREKIFLDYAGFRTLDSVIRASKVFGLKHFTVISQKFHNERAIYIARKNGIQAVGFNAKDVNKSYGFKTRLREKFARVKVVFDLIVGIAPKFLGERIAIQ